MKIHKFHNFPPISPVFGPAALARKKDSNSYAFSMVAALMFPPRAPQNLFFWKILVSNQNFGDFHANLWNLAPELGFKDSEGSLAGPGWKPQYSYRNIEVSEPPRTTRITPKQKKLKIPAQIALFHSKTGFSASGAKKISPERYVYVGFWAGAANVDFWSHRGVFGARNHKRLYFIGFHRIL